MPVAQAHLFLIKFIAIEKIQFVQQNKLNKKQATVIVSIAL